MQPARPLRPVRARSAQAQPAHAPHPGPRDLGRGLHAGRARDGRGRLRAQAGRRASSWSTRCRELEDAGSRSGMRARAGRRGRRGAAREHLRSCSAPTTSSIVAVATAARGARAAARARPSTAWCSTSRCPTRRASSCSRRWPSDEPYSFPPVIVYTGRVALARTRSSSCARYSSSIIIKGARSPERLLDEVTLFLHQVEADLPADASACCARRAAATRVFEGRRILRRRGRRAQHLRADRACSSRTARSSRSRATAARRSSTLAAARPHRPRADGHHDAGDGRPRRRCARSASARRWRKLPIIALTAKAMPDDQRALPRRRRQRLHHQADRRREAAVADARLDAEVKGDAA